MKTTGTGGWSYKERALLNSGHPASQACYKGEIDFIDMLGAECKLVGIRRDGYTSDEALSLIGQTKDIAEWKQLFTEKQLPKCQWDTQFTLRGQLA